MDYIALLFVSSQLAPTLSLQFFTVTAKSTAQICGALAKNGIKCSWACGPCKGTGSANCVKNKFLGVGDLEDNKDQWILIFRFFITFGYFKLKKSRMFSLLVKILNWVIVVILHLMSGYCQIKRGLALMEYLSERIHLIFNSERISKFT